MLVVKGVFFGIALFIIGSVAYMLLAHKLNRSGVISTGSPYLWIAFVGSLAIGYVISIRGLWVFQGVLFGLVMFIVEMVVLWIAYARSVNAPSQTPVAIAFNVSHLLPWFLVALVSSVGLALAIVALWPPTGRIPVR
jgi:hypothetical protein